MRSEDPLFMIHTLLNCTVWRATIFCIPFFSY